MELKESLKEHRARLGLSQEELAERIFVSRQTISNWETDRTYPDVQSLLLLSELFETSIDELVKGDVATMEKTIKETWKTMQNWALAAWGGRRIHLPDCGIPAADGPLVAGGQLHRG